MLGTLLSVVYSALRAGSNAAFFTVVDDAPRGTLLTAPAVDDSDDEVSFRYSAPALYTGWSVRWERRVLDVCAPHVPYNTPVEPSSHWPQGGGGTGAAQCVVYPLSAADWFSPC
eukprot:7017711-Pyramimonas_sp.AAC.1